MAYHPRYAAEVKADRKLRLDLGLCTTAGCDQPHSKTSRWYCLRHAQLQSQKILRLKLKKKESKVVEQNPTHHGFGGCIGVDSHPDTISVETSIKENKDGTN